MRVAGHTNVKYDDVELGNYGHVRSAIARKYTVLSEGEERHVEQK